MPDLILALDVLERASAEKIVQATCDSIDAIKLGYPLVLAQGLSIARRLQEISTDMPFIADFKVADIPNTNRLIAEQVFNAGFKSIICHGFPGSDAITACADVAHDAGGRCFVVAEMSHPGACAFYHGGIAQQIAEMAIESGADGIIAPATRPDRVKVLREIIGDALIYSPGIGTQGGDAKEIASLVDGMIVGRSIYEASDPKAAAAEYAKFRT